MIRIYEDVQQLHDEIVSIRRALHQIPESGFQEYETSQYIKQVLEPLEFEVYDQVAQTGVAAFLRGTEGNRTIAFRADMDALPINEENACAYISQHKGFMHACGHDAHMAIVLGMAKYLSAHKDRVKENILCIFQPAEEGPGGAERIVREGILKNFNVEAIYGLHLFPGLDEGKIGVRPGAIMARNAEMDIVITGKGGHGAAPHTAVDAIVAAAEFISSLQTILSRTVNPIEPALITIGKVSGGFVRNVIADSVKLEGIIRTFNENVYDEIKDRIHRLGKSLDMAYGTKTEPEIRDMYPPVVNDERLYDEFLSIFDKEDVELIEPQMISEDFAFYQKAVPGLFFFLGTGNPEKGFTAPLHNAKFNFDEKILVTGVQIFIDVLESKNVMRNA